MIPLVERLEKQIPAQIRDQHEQHVAAVASSGQVKQNVETFRYSILVSPSAAWLEIESAATERCSLFAESPSRHIEKNRSTEVVPHQHTEDRRLLDAQAQAVRSGCPHLPPNVDRLLSRRDCVPLVPLIARLTSRTRVWGPANDQFASVPKGLRNSDGGTEVCDFSAVEAVS